VIRSFADDLSADLFHDRFTNVTKRFPSNLRRVAQRKLQYLNAALKLQDLSSPPGNRLEALRGNLNGFYSIRINDQWRILFRWELEGAFKVCIDDYH
jgi:toxin HigB-1